MIVYVYLSINFIIRRLLATSSIELYEPRPGKYTVQVDLQRVERLWNSTMHLYTVRNSHFVQLRVLFSKYRSHKRRQSNNKRASKQIQTENGRTSEQRSFLDTFANVRPNITHS